VQKYIVSIKKRLLDLAVTGLCEACDRRLKDIKSNFPRFSSGQQYSAEVQGLIARTEENCLMVKTKGHFIFGHIMELTHSAEDAKLANTLNKMDLACDMKEKAPEKAPSNLDRTKFTKEIAMMVRKDLKKDVSIKSLLFYLLENFANHSSMPGNWMAAAKIWEICTQNEARPALSTPEERQTSNQGKSTKKKNQGGGEERAATLAAASDNSTLASGK